MPSPAKPAPTISAEAGFAWRLAAAFLGAAFFAGVLLAAAFVLAFLAAAFLAVAFLAVVFLAVAFLAMAFFAAAFLRGALAAFFAAPLLTAVSSAFTAGWSATRLSLLLGVSSFIEIHWLKDRIERVIAWQADVGAGFVGAGPVGAGLARERVALATRQDPRDAVWCALPGLSGIQPAGFAGLSLASKLAQTLLP
ncbi:hypothetical protein [Alloalcanivorax venustensis]|uniref:hypothetical protein n=1 Tax=Alloalcanivorax venustensis TaxID=172371 RepID=UPI003511228F